jgi:hypothetical protein
MVLILKAGYADQLAVFISSSSSRFALKPNCMRSTVAHPSQANTTESDYCYYLQKLRNRTEKEWKMA